jgi:mannose-6-phosphate isomerase
MPYAWGSRTAIAGLQGRPTPSDQPEAELWMGAHPRGPSRLVRAGVETTLVDVIDGSAERELGAATLGRFGRKLPFLLKVLAAGQPLSLQAHPSVAQAEAGFAREDALGIPLDAPHRNYKDRNHKPELICALTPFDALCGFRRVSDTVALFDALGVSQLDATMAPLRWSDAAAGLAATLHAIMTKQQPASAEMVEATLAACRVHDGPWRRECQWALRLAELYPDDPGIVTALLLNLVHLQPGEAIYLGAGNLHAYLDGVGVEIMASSDNVLRGGLTTKHVDVEELLAVLEFIDGPVPVLSPVPVDAHEVSWPTPAPEFRLSRVDVRGAAVTRRVDGPEILICTQGQLDVQDQSGRAAVTLVTGLACFVPGTGVSMTLTGVGTVFRAAVGLPAPA